MKGKVFIEILVIFLIIMLLLLINCRESKKWEETVKFQNGKNITVNHYLSKKKYYGGRHSFGFGGGDPWHKIWFEYEGLTYKWENKFIPILLNVFEGSFYIVAFDRETSKMSFRFYKFDKKWIEIPYKEFPKSIAIQNMWLKKNSGYLNGKPINEYQIVEDLDPTYFPFRESLTAKMWLCLEKGIRYYEAPDLVDEKFLIEYKRKYIRKNESLPVARH